MGEKINSKDNIWPLFKYLKFISFAIIFLLIIYTRFINIGWGLPYPMHPDERNMASSVIQLKCDMPRFEFNLPYGINGNWDVTKWLKVSEFNINDCFNPRFFAYGQFPLYLSYVMVYVLKFFDGDLNIPVGFLEATLALRLISAIASVLNAIIVMKLAGLFFENKIKRFTSMLLGGIVIMAAPYAIQSAHFGTTESLLMLFYTTLIYLSLKLLGNKISDLSYVILSSITLGLAVATKISSVTFLIVPAVALIASKNNKLPYPLWYTMFKKTLDLWFLIFFTSIIFIIFSPHTIINLDEFLGSMAYESGVALGQFTVFYTRQFIETVPILFQIEKVFPAALGIAGTVLFFIAFFFLSWSDKKINFMRLAFLAYFLPNAFIFAKWTRFMAPVYPLMTVFAIMLLQYFIFHLKPSKAISNLLLAIIIALFILPGLGYVSIYNNKDVRFQASDWIYKNIPDNSYILSETANVVDIPLDYVVDTGDKDYEKNFQVVSFNFYDLDSDPGLQTELSQHLERADYIFVPSRRIFANHYCNPSTSDQMVQRLLSLSGQRCIIIEEQYPAINNYYEELFTGKAGFVKVAEFKSNPKIVINDITLLEFQDENFEETWSVFDHPVIRIYKKS